MWGCTVRHWVAVCVPLIACAASVPEAAAQTGSLFGSGGPLSSSTMGGSSAMGMGGVGSTGSMGGATGAFSGTSNMIGTSGFNPLQGMGGTGAGGMGATGMTGMTGTTGMTGAGGQQGSGFLGRSASTQFLGSNQTSTQQLGGNRGLNGMNGMNQIGQGGRGNNGRNNRGNANNNNQFMNQQGGGSRQQQQKQVRPQLTVDFAYPQPTAAKMTQHLDTRFQKLATRLPVKNVQIVAVDGVVTLRGQVASEDKRKLAENLARLEPGVKSIQNELTVSGPAAQ